MICLFADWAWTRGLFLALSAQWLVDLHLKHSPLLVLPPVDGEASLAPLGCPEVARHG